MKSLYITSVERYSGKTAVCLALGKQFQEDGHRRKGCIRPKTKVSKPKKSPDSPTVLH